MPEFLGHRQYGIVCRRAAGPPAWRENAAAGRPYRRSITNTDIIACAMRPSGRLSAAAAVEPATEAAGQAAVDYRRRIFRAYQPRRQACAYYHGLITSPLRFCRAVRTMHVVVIAERAGEECRFRLFTMIYLFSAITTGRALPSRQWPDSGADAARFLA